MILDELAEFATTAVAPSREGYGDNGNNKGQMHVDSESHVVVPQEPHESKNNGQHEAAHTTLSMKKGHAKQGNTSKTAGEENDNEAGEGEGRRRRAVFVRRDENPPRQQGCDT